MPIACKRPSADGNIVTLMPALRLAGAGGEGMPVYPDIGVQAACSSPLYRDSRQGRLKTKRLPEVLSVRFVTQCYAAVIPHSLHKTYLASHAKRAL